MFSSLKKKIVKAGSAVIPEEQFIAVLRARRRILARAKAFLFPRKSKWYCPCCNTRFPSFIAWNYLQFPEIYDSQRYRNTPQEVLCPICWSLPRHRILASWCRDHVHMLRSAEILYFAPEYSMMNWMRRNKVKCLSADLYKKADLQLDIQKTNLPDEMFGIIFCNHVLEHVESYQSALIEMHRILKKGGLFICSFPIDGKTEYVYEDQTAVSATQRVKMFGHRDHKRVFGLKAAQLLTNAGFHVTLLSGNDCPVSILPITGPADYDVNWLYLCKKE